MEKKISAFYKKEKLICLIAVIIGFAFAIQYFFATYVSAEYTYLFYTMTGFGLVYIFHYGYRWLFLNRREKAALSEFKTTPSSFAQNENAWLSKRFIEHKNYKFLLEILVFIGALAFVIALTGFYKTVLGASGVGVMMGAGFWLCFELFSEFQTKEYEHFVEKHR